MGGLYGVIVGLLLGLIFDQVGLGIALGFFIGCFWSLARPERHADPAAQPEDEEGRSA